MEIRIREATEQDIEKLLTFEQGVIEAERPFDPTLKAGHITYSALPGLMASNQAILAVAEHQGELVASGYARLEPAKPYLKHEQHAYLGFMFVDPAHRGKGINRLIIEYLIEWARSQSIHELRLDVYVENGPAIKAYEKLGFSKHLVEMRLNTEDQPGGLNL
ncbi:MAG: GNAT family N-acetyltransferase [Solitalea sp.]